MRLSCVRVLVFALLAATHASAGTTVPRPQPQHLRALDRMMSSLSLESVRGASAIRDAYDEHLELLYLEKYAAMEGALATGGLVPLPPNPTAFNVFPRLEGEHPIGEKDLVNQESYLAARAFTIGCLLEIASRVRSGPVEITSLVRHGEYQDALLRTNGNARTEVPTHTMGLAFDIALINSSLETGYEIRDVLREMRDAGDLLFIGERKQLVFHVVPHPARLGHFMDVYTRALGAPSAVQAAHVVAPAPPLLDVIVPERDTPRVVAEVVALVPADAALNPEWRAALNDEATPAPPQPIPSVPAVGKVLAAILLGAAFPAVLLAFVRLRS